jgi:iron complex outermembrane recepter protein
MFKSIFVTAVILWSMSAHAQEYSIYGKVRQVNGNRPLAGATLEVKEIKRFSVSDELGNFRITQLPPGDYTVVVRFLGFHEKTEALNVADDVAIDFNLEESSQITDEVVVFATRASDNTPTTFTDVGKASVQKQNFGQDLPILLNWTPSIVTTSDAGTGIGYTGLRIRGSDASRINVTINGIALNDSESQGVFWVNTPDLSSSVQSIQVQRGVGTSTNGAGAFGATVSVQTDALMQIPYGEAMISAGSFGSQRYTFKSGTGLINDRWAFDGRISKIKSDGYLERAASDLDSYYLSGGFYGKKTIVKAIMFGGHEETYQAWYGIDAGTMKTNRRFNYAGAIYDDEGNIIRYYDKEVDDYKQDHYQLHVSQQFSKTWNGNVSLHYTKGLGFFEQYKQDESFEDLGLPDASIAGSTISSSDVIVRRWLDNDYYGLTFSSTYSQIKSDLTIGGAYSRYDNARHFGEIIWAEIAVNSPLRYVYYDGESEKSDFNIYAKWNYDLTERLHSYVDLQYRTVNYQTAGIDNDQSPYSVTDQFNFFNPKAGLSYSIDPNSLLYASYAIANREPNRSDYLDGIEKPKSEKLGNLEIGWRRSGSAYGMEVNYYLMNYTDQLVLTGGVSDTGYPIRANVGKSYRTGIELSGSVTLNEKLNWNANATWSLNKNQDYAMLDENNNATTRNTSIILSPSWICGSNFTWRAFKNFQAVLLSKYVGKQYLDNNENEEVKLEPYFINDIRISYQFQPKAVRFVELGLLVNNIFDVEYSSNGYGYDGAPYYFPQAGVNFMAMITVKI